MIEPDAAMNELTKNVIGAAIEVHRHLGPGFLEAVYERALAIELGLLGMRCSQQQPASVSYKGYDVGEGRLDIVVEDCLVVELKAIDRVADIHKAQVISYLKATGHQLGLLINFNTEVLHHGVHRIVLT